VRAAIAALGDMVRMTANDNTGEACRMMLAKEHRLSALSP